MQGKVVCIVGVGLIGGSMALALKECGFASRIIGVENSKENGYRALDLGIVDEIATLERGVVESDMVLLATPVDAICSELHRVLERVLSIKEERESLPVVCDMGSTKQKIVESVDGHPLRGRYVAAHPIAGTENSGPEAAFSSLFKGKNAILCNTKQSDKEAVELVETMLKMVGMNISHMDAKGHDMHVAYVSHLSHITSFALAISVLSKEKIEKSILMLAAGGFESTVRLAKSRGETWAPIFFHNKEFVVEAIDSYINSVMLFRDALVNGSREDMLTHMSYANEIRKILKKD